MPTYLLQFTVESCLTKTTDVTINRDGVDVTFLFSKRQTNDKYVRAQTKLEAANNREAQGKASTDVEGLHNLRHSLSNWLVNKAKENPKTVQGILGHARIQTTLDLYTDEDLDEMIPAQKKFLNAVGFESGSVQ